ncbi:MAG: leucine-rich repeat protein [Clostridia bacterium]|nr:leucine-rich repeat protein [Clostridia bacterium]
MKRNILKTVLFSALIAIFTAITAFVSSAEEIKTINVSYYDGDTIKFSQDCICNYDSDGDGVLDAYIEDTATLADYQKLYPEENFRSLEEVPDELRIYDINEGDIYRVQYNGHKTWFSDDGVLYQPDGTTAKGIILTKDTRFYKVGTIYKANNMTELAANLQNNWRYVQLNFDITTDEALNCLPWPGTSILDLNGHSITSSARTVFSQQRAGLILVGKGTITHTSTDANAAIFETSWHGWGDGGQRLWISKDITITTNGTLFRSTNSLHNIDGLPSIRIYGNTTSSSIARTNGVSRASIDIYPSASVTVTGTYFFEDQSTLDDRIIMQLTIHGGRINIPSDKDGFTEFISGYDSDLHTFTIRGGTFNRNIEKLISTDFKCEGNDTDGYEVVPNICSVSPTSKHDYIITSLSVTCTEDGSITYNCLYCNEMYTVERAALGHTLVAKQTQEIINTPEKTSPGIYTNFCPRCNYSYEEYYYPDPAKAYINVYVRKDGVEKTIRIRAEELFGFQQDGSLTGETMLVAYTLTTLKYVNPNTGITETYDRSQIIGFDIPLGTTTVQGGYYSYASTPLGTFYNENYIEKINLPESLINIEQYAFAMMDNLSEVNGIENVSGKIEDNAFAQDAASKLSFQTLKLNAKEIGNYSFKNCLVTAIIIGENTKIIRNAWTYDGALKYRARIREVLFEKFTEEDYPDMNGVTVAKANGHKALFTTCTSTFLRDAKVYYDHNIETVVYAPTCTDLGYTAVECTRCKEGTKSDFVPALGPEAHQWSLSPDDDKASTCSTQGFIAEKCSICASIKANSYLPLDPNVHDFSYGKAPQEGACTASPETGWYWVMTCKCGAKDTAIIEGSHEVNPINAGHTSTTTEFFKITEKVAATCGAAGYTKKQCLYCSYTVTEEKAATGSHILVLNENTSIPATCGTSGKNCYFCSNDCGYTDEIIVPKLTGSAADSSHEYGEAITLNEATYTKKGLQQKQCIYCFKQEYIETPTLAKETLFDHIKAAYEKTWVKVVTICVVCVLVIGGLALAAYFVIFRKADRGRKFQYSFEKNSTYDTKKSKKFKKRK